MEAPSANGGTKYQGRNQALTEEPSAEGGTKLWWRNKTLMEEPSPKRGIKHRWRNQALMEEPRTDGGTKLWLEEPSTNGGAKQRWRNQMLMEAPNTDGGTKHWWKHQALIEEPNIDGGTKQHWRKQALMEAPSTDGGTKHWWKNMGVRTHLHRSGMEEFLVLRHESSFLKHRFSVSLVDNRPLSSKFEDLQSQWTLSHRTCCLPIYLQGHADGKVLLQVSSFQLLFSEWHHQFLSPDPKNPWSISPSLCHIHSTSSTWTLMRLPGARYFFSTASVASVVTDLLPFLVS